jgi:hypothetical protein
MAPQEQEQEHALYDILLTLYSQDDKEGKYPKTLIYDATGYSRLAAIARASDLRLLFTDNSGWMFTPRKRGFEPIKPAMDDPMLRGCLEDPEEQIQTALPDIASRRFLTTEELKQLGPGVVRQIPGGMLDPLPLSQKEREFLANAEAISEDEFLAQQPRPSLYDSADNDENLTDEARKILRQLDQDLDDGKPF